MKKFFSFKDAFYLDNSNATSFSSIGHSGGKLFNLLTFLGIMEVQNGLQGGSEGMGEKFFH